jgi:outer membrane protein OmpA-like peptidoglycan-associated protein/tetratricopeptide (TPR) repeat protein
MRVLFLSAFFILAAKGTFAFSDKDSLKAGQLKSFGKHSLEQGDVYSASKFFEAYLEKKPDDAKIAYSLADCYRLSRNYQKASEWYSKAYDVDPADNILALFYLGCMLKSQGDYKTAREKLTTFKTKYKGEERFYKKLAEAELEGCDMAKPIPDSAMKFQIIHLDTSINKAHIESSPFPVTDSAFIFSSLRLDSSNYYSIDQSEEDLPVRKLYVARIKNGKWKYESEFTGPYNIDGVNTANGIYSVDRQLFFFTRSEKNWRNKKLSSIYICYKDKNGKWADPEKADGNINLSGYTNTQPTIGVESKKNQDVLYFVSDRPGGKGGLDIWYSIYNRKSNSFKPAKNAGSKLNTAGDESTPYYDLESHSLYFSSNGWPGLGGLDVFNTTGELTKWTEPENIGPPVNSGADDLYYVLHKSKKEGFFTSNRKGGIVLENPTCCDDIYTFERRKFFNVFVKGKVIDSEDSLVRGTLVALSIIDSASHEAVFIKEDTVKETGNYLMKLEPGKLYSLTVKKPGYFNEILEVSTKNINKPDTIEAKPLSIKPIPVDKSLVVNNIEYGLNKYELDDAAKKKIDETIFTVLNENRGFRVEISSHTDNTGNDKLNQILSQKRADGVVKYLVSKGIPKSRMKAVGYGETKPIADNQFEDGKNNEEGMRKNRRTEFKIIEDRF